MVVAVAGIMMAQGQCSYRILCQGLKKVVLVLEVLLRLRWSQLRVRSRVAMEL